MRVKDIRRQPGHLIRRAYQHIMAVFMEEAREFGITPVQYSALIVIREFPGTDATRVSDMIHFDRATIGNVLTRLESKGLIRREYGEQDKRTKPIYLLPKGEALLEKVDMVAPRVSKKILAPLNEEDRAALERILLQLIGTEESYSDDQMVLTREV